MNSHGNFPKVGKADYLSRGPFSCSRDDCLACQSSESGAHLFARGIPAQMRTLQGSAGTAQISADRSFGINYGHRIVGAKVTALYGEVEFVAIPNRPVTAANATVPQNYASLYLAPGVRLKFFPNSRLSPWAAAGGGLDYRLFRFIGLRGEVRDFFSGNPNLNTALSSSTQHNVVASGGIILRF
jgi:hypothetical protein